VFVDGLKSGIWHCSPGGGKTSGNRCGRALHLHQLKSVLVTVFSWCNPAVVRWEERNTGENRIFSRGGHGQAH
jgi:hypothetical protein